MKIIQKVLFIVVPIVFISYALLQLSGSGTKSEAYAANSNNDGINNLFVQLSQKGKYNPDDQYKALETFMGVLDLVDKNYVETIDKKEAIYGAIKGMLEELDPHSSFMTPEEFNSFQQSTSGSFGGLGITITMKNDLLTVMSAIEDTPAWQAGIKGGDVIALINGEPTANMTLDEAVKKMRGKSGSKIKLTITRKGESKPIDLTLTRAIIKIKSVKYEMIDKELGYIRLTQFQENSYREMADAVRALTNSGAKGLVLDLRNNGGGLLNEAISIASIFLPVNQTVVFTRERDKQEKHYKTESVNFSNRTIPMVIIVNEWSASASEIIAGSMQDYKRAVIVGKSTFGKGSVQSIVPLPDGSAVRLTTSRYYTPAARSIQGVGIKPDVEVEPGIIEYTSDYYVIKEKDLSGHLKGENEKDNSAAVDDAVKRASQVLPLNDDLQYISAVQVLKGMLVYGSTTNK